MFLSTQLKNALNTVEDIYTQRITHYRRLLERVREYQCRSLIVRLMLFFHTYIRPNRRQHNNFWR